MWRKILIISIALVCLMVTGLLAQKNQYRKADHALRAVYKDVTGTSLENAIDQLIAEQRGKRMGDGNVIVRFNGGGTRNKLYIGRDNRLEFLVENDFYLQAASLGFEFSCTGGPGSFSWVHGYGSLPANDPVVDMNPDIFFTYPWDGRVGIQGEPYQITLGGVAFNLQALIDINFSPTLLYSMQIHINDDPGLVGDTFYIDNVFIPPACDWRFQEYGDTLPPGYAPDYQWMPNDSTTNPTAPPVAFEIAEPKCEFAGKSTDPGIIYIPDDSLIRPEMITDIKIVPGKDGTHLVGVRIGYEGDKGAIDKLEIGFRWLSKNVMSGAVPIELLPNLCQIPGVLYIEPQPRVGLELNYSTDDINCVYSNIQSNLGVSGDSVIIGIIDAGLDWLHEDFIDSNGNSRIKHPQITIN
ncbi:MAG: hypothetical protein GF310_07975 [candidate division Zixibacteria bacterium]|nr:hypothetical protein [candidate division Zixibacteria bacterium]